LGLKLNAMHSSGIEQPSGQAAATAGAQSFAESVECFEARRDAKIAQAKAQYD